MTINANTYVTKADGSLIYARLLRKGDSLLGLNKDNEVVPQRILSIEKTGMRSNWLNIKGPRNPFGRGSAFYSGIFSPCQEISNLDNTWVKLSEINPVITVKGISNSLMLSRVQKSILLGILLGDGSLKKTAASMSLKWSHSNKQLDYLHWTIEALGAIAKRSEDYTSGYGSESHTARTLFHPDIELALRGFDKPNGNIPKWVAEELNPISLAYWYMDDGSLTHNANQRDRVSFATYSFSVESHNILIDGLKRMNITAKIQSSSKGNTLRLNSESADFFFCLVAPYIPPSMQYKLPVYYRGNQGWIPKTTTNFKEIQTNATVSSIEPSVNKHGLAVKRSEYKLVTEYNNFFSHGLLLKGHL